MINVLENKRIILEKAIQILIILNRLTSVMLTLPTIAHKPNDNLSNLNPILMINIISYLQEEELNNLIEGIHNNKNYSTLQKIGKIKLMLMEYLNKADRSYYFTIYATPAYSKYENNQFAALALNQNSQLFYQFSNKYARVLQQAQNCVDEEIRNEFGEKLKNIFVDPCLPTPKLLRETVAAAVNSPFQSFLIQQFNIQNQYGANIYEEVFETVKEKFQQREQEFIRNMVGNYGVIHEIRNLAHTIDFENYESKLIAGNQLHNFIVLLLAMTQLHLKLVKQFLERISDPFELLLQLTLKYTQFNNTVIAMEENLGFVFETYSELYSELFKKQKSKFSYWKSAYIMWISKMSDFHDVTNKVYASILRENNNAFMEEIISDEKYAQIYPKIIFNLKLDSVKEYLNYKNQVYQIMKNEEDSEIMSLLNTYREYLVDMSIDECSVHECGYSNQQLDQIYLQSEQILIEEEQKFVKNLKKCEFSDNQKVLIGEVLQKRMSNYEKNVKPSTFKSFLNLYKKESFKINASQLETNDKQIERYLNHISKNRFANSSRHEKSLYAIAKNIEEKTLSETLDSQKSDIDYQLQFYDSENQMEDEEPRHHSLIVG